MSRSERQGTSWVGSSVRRRPGKTKISPVVESTSEVLEKIVDRLDQLIILQTRIVSEIGLVARQQARLSDSIAKLRSDASGFPVRPKWREVTHQTAARKSDAKGPSSKTSTSLTDAEREALNDHAKLKALGLKRGRGRPRLGELTAKQIAAVVMSPEPEVALALARARNETAIKKRA